MLISCATWTPDPLAPPLCSVLAMVAYRHGDGALAQIAVDRCLLAEPEHPLAHLMIAIMAAGVHPEELNGSAPTDGRLSVVVPAGAMLSPSADRPLVRPQVMTHGRGQLVDQSRYGASARRWTAW